MSDPVNNNLFTKQPNETASDSEEEQKITPSEERTHRVASGILHNTRGFNNELNPSIFAPSVRNPGVRSRSTRTPPPIDKKPAIYPTPPKMKDITRRAMQETNEFMSEDERSEGELYSDDSRGPSPSPYISPETFTNQPNQNQIIKPKPVKPSSKSTPFSSSSSSSSGFRPASLLNSSYSSEPAANPIHSIFSSRLLVSSKNTFLSSFAQIPGSPALNRSREEQKEPLSIFRRKPPVGHTRSKSGGSSFIRRREPAPTSEELSFTPLRSTSSSSSSSSSSYNLLGTALIAGLPSSGKGSGSFSKEPPPAPKRKPMRRRSDPMHRTKEDAPIHRYVNVEGFGKVSFSSDILKNFEKKMSAIGHVLSPSGNPFILKIAQGLEVFFDDDKGTPLAYSEILRTYSIMVQTQYTLLNSHKNLVSAFPTQFAFASSDLTEETPSFQSENAQFVLIQKKAPYLLVEGDRHFFKELYSQNQEVFFSLLSLIFEGVFQALKTEQNDINLQALMSLDLKPENFAFTSSREEIAAILNNPEKPSKQKAEEIFSKMASFDFHYQPQDQHLVFAANFKKFLVDSVEEDHKIIRFFISMVEKEKVPSPHGERRFPEKIRHFMDGLLLSLHSS